MKDSIANTKGKWLYSVFWATLSLSIGLSGQCLLVFANYGGNWTALFRTGDHSPLPPEISEKTHVFENNAGYDGQFYRYVAHDPLALKGLWKSVDSPAIRYSRIFIPGLSYLLAGGQDKDIDKAYYVIVAISLFFGTFWTSQWAISYHHHPAWGLGFLFLPGTVVSLWMMTGEIALLVLTVAFANFWHSGNRVGLYISLVLSALCRETGIILSAGLCGWFLLRKEYRSGFIYATALIPTGIWYGYIHTAIPGSSSVIPSWLISEPASGIFGALFKPGVFAAPANIIPLVQFLDMVSILGMVILFIVALRRLWLAHLSPITLSAGLHIGLGIVVNNAEFWRVPLGYTRPFSTLLVLQCLQCLTSEPSLKEKWITLASILTICLRIIFQLVYSEGSRMFH